MAGNTLERLSVDLSGWVEQTILLRFRVVTNSLPNSIYNPYAGQTLPKSVFVDDVSIYGEGSASVIPVYYVF